MQLLNKNIHNNNIKRNIESIQKLEGLVLSRHQDFIQKGKRLLDDRQGGKVRGKTQEEFRGKVKMIIKSLKAFDAISASDNDLLDKIVRIERKYGKCSMIHNARDLKNLATTVQQVIKLLKTDY